MPVVIREDTENQYNWDRIEETYIDGFDALTRRVTYFDDGTVRDDVFRRSGLDDVLGRRTILDNPDIPEFSGVQPWNRVDIEYDDNQQVERRTIAFDNGVASSEEFSEGVRIFLDEFDGPQPERDWTTGELVQPEDPGAFTWQSIFSEFDAVTGQITHRDTTYDNGVVNLEDFVNGVRTTLREFDGPQPQRDWTTGEMVQPEDPGAFAWQSRFSEFDEVTARSRTAIRHTTTASWTSRIFRTVSEFSSENTTDHSRNAIGRQARWCNRMIPELSPGSHPSRNSMRRRARSHIAKPHTTMVS